MRVLREVGDLRRLRVLTREGVRAALDLPEHLRNIRLRLNDATLRGT